MAQLLNVSTHHQSDLLLTTSQDTTFRLWDFRTPALQAVNVFQGHSEYVRCAAASASARTDAACSAVSTAVFASNDSLIVSGSEDRTIKVWRRLALQHDEARASCAD